MNVKYAPVAQLDRVSDSDSEGRAFESHQAYHNNIIRTFLFVITANLRGRESSTAEVFYLCSTKKTPCPVILPPKKAVQGDLVVWVYALCTSQILL